jgi:hypothetical protein
MKVLLEKTLKGRFVSLWKSKQFAHGITNAMSFLLEDWVRSNFRNILLGRPRFAEAASQWHSRWTGLEPIYYKQKSPTCGANSK